MNFFKGLVDVILADDAQSFKSLKSQIKYSDASLRLLRKYGVATVSKLSEILQCNEEALEQLTKQIEIDNDTISQLSHSLDLKQDLEQRMLNYKRQVVDLEAECDELRTKDAINRANISQLTKELVYYKELVESKSEIISGLAIKLYKKDTIKDKSLESELAFARANINDMRIKLLNYQKSSSRSNLSDNNSVNKSISITADDATDFRHNAIDKLGDLTGNIKGMLGDLSEMSSNILTRSATKLKSSVDDKSSLDEIYNERTYQSLLDREARAIRLAEKFAIELLNNSQKENGRSLLNSEAELLMDKRLTSLSSQVQSMKSQMEAEREKYTQVATMNEELRATCSELKKMINMSSDVIEPPIPNKIEIVYINALDILDLDLPSSIIDSKSYNFASHDSNKQDKPEMKIDNWDDLDDPWEEFTPQKPKSPPKNPIKSNENVMKPTTSNVWDQDMDCFDDV